MLNSRVPSSDFSAHLHPRLDPAHYLIVLVPYLDIDFAAMARRVWELASVSDAHVLFLGLYFDPAQEPGLRRELITMSAMLNDGSVSVEADLVLGNNWLNTVKDYVRAGDTVVCLAEQRTGVLRKPLSQILEAELDVPLYILSGIFSQSDSHPGVLSQVWAWAGSIALLGVFFFLQSEIIRFIQGSFQVAWLLVSVVFEFWMIWAWNNLFS